MTRGVFVVYVLRSIRDGGLYIGQTEDIVRRIKEHNFCKVPSTKARGPFTLVYMEAVGCRLAARELEKKFKMGYMREKFKALVNLLN